ncbi:MAG TPA: oxidoreductase, partial [Oxalobacteraceae bacterium]|nr:oxidoreductase [Oxalobacteraceae bacterium]HCN89472.1 oxidoreductase [Oxalobacteraceae bacterium]
RAAGIKRVIVVGGAGSLEIGGGKQLVDSPDFPAAYKSYALAHRDALAVLRDAPDIDWTFFAPAAEIGPSDKVGKFRVGARKLITDAAGRSAISYADYADAFVSEIEAGSHPKEIVTVAY